MKNISISSDAISTMTKEQLTAWLGTASKRANQRMRQLEKDSLATSSLAYQHIKTREVDHSSSLAKTRHGEIKFKTSFKGRTIQDLRRQAKDVLGFLNAKTSTSKGTKNKYQKSLDKFNETMKKRWIEDGNSPETFKPASMSAWANIWQSENLKKLQSLLPSDQIAEIYQYGEDNGLSDAQMEDIVDAIINRDHMDGMTAYKEIREKINEYSKAVENGEIEPNGTDSLTKEDWDIINGIGSLY